jgi:hypothetical protein
MAPSATSPTTAGPDGDPFPVILLLASSCSRRSQSHREGEGFRHLYDFPFRDDFERLDCPRLVDMQHDIELIGQPALKISRKQADSDVWKIAS